MALSIMTLSVSIIILGMQSEIIIITNNRKTINRPTLSITTLSIMPLSIMTS